MGSRGARVVVGALLACLSGLYALTAVGHSVVVLVVSCVLCAGVLGVWLRSLRRGWTGWDLGVLAVCVYAVVAPGWVSVGLVGMLGGAFVVAGWSWTAGAVAVSALALAAARGGSVAHVLDDALTAVLTGVLVVGLARLVARIDGRAAARMTLALAAVEDERLRVAAELNAGPGKALDAIAEARPDDLEATLTTARDALGTARAASVELRSLSLAPEIAAAKGLLASGGIEADVRTGHTEPLGRAGALLAVVLREAVTDVVRRGTARHCEITTAEKDGLLTLRVVNDGVRTSEQGADALDGLETRIAEAGGRLKTGLEDDGRFAVEASVKVPEEKPVAEATAERRLAVGLLAATVLVLSVKGVLQVPVRELPVVIPSLLAMGILLRWTRPRGRWWAALLAVQAAASFVPLVALHEPWGTLPGFLIGSMFVLMPARVATALALAVITATGAAVRGHGMVVNTLVSVPLTALVVYGLLRLARLADELADAAAAQARAAVVQERLRAARDLHDLLGHGLAAILIKGELARRLAARDQDRAAGEFADMVAMAERARADMAAVTGAAPRLEFGPELDSAQGVLEAAGIEVTVERKDDPPEDAEPVLAIVLREAVTNILRHSSAQHVEITVTNDSLTVSNDGVSGDVTPPGSGLGNLATRLAAINATLEATHTPKRFRLAVRLSDEPSPHSERVI
ncbi:sensor histidine kinase [Actinomadura rupiterrae]|uniref:sensor histidine kinase n=1 Tax=Actinomadura rupiterrae TaxID=559627 RepID=UPI0020A34163|nr:histidine kinase [Actinomadura rupiterrae]MCP2343010.1 signal transduction histidine kinase [Actinomadura rupiterrae]